jgi:protein TonB
VTPGPPYEPPSLAFPGNDPEAVRSGELLRYLLVPAVAVVLFFGGVYWLRLKVDAAGAVPESTTSVQVHLLPRPDAVPIPVASAAQSTAVSTPSEVTGPTDAPAVISNQLLAALPSDAPAPAEPVAPGVSLRSPPIAASNSATLEFRDALLRHIARFQRYPRAAERQHLQGTVRAVFAVRRDGKVLDAWVKTSSGQTVLDQAAIDTIRRAQPLPAIPAALPDSIKIELALGFDPS